MGTAYTLVQDLLRSNALTVFSSKQATFDELMADNLSRPAPCRRGYIWYMAHKLRHLFACKWIARIMKLNSYLTEFPIPPRVVTRKMDREEI
eukprot:5597665-Ditylum_brightwellii.AAC.2